VHEVDDLDAFMAAGAGLSTPAAKKIAAGAKTFETSTWELFLVRGNATEKLGAVPQPRM